MNPLSKLALLQPLRTSRSFSALWGGQFLSGFGDAAFSVILPMVVYSLTGSALAMGLLMTLRVFPRILVQPFTGVLVDRFSRVSMMMISDSARFLLLVLLTVLGVMHRLTIPALDVFAFLYGLMSALFQPAYMALRQQVFTPDIRTAAISLTQISTETTNLVGPSFGGIILSLASAVFGFAIDALTFVASIISLLFIGKTDSSLKSSRSSSGPKNFFRDLADGYRETIRHPWVWVGIISWTFIIIAYSGIIPILVPWLVKVHFHDPDYAYGLVVSMSGLGALLVGIIAGSVTTWRHRGVLAYGAIGIRALALLAIAFVHSLPGLMLMMAISAAGDMFFAIIHEGILQELVPQELFGRVISLEIFCASIALPIGYALTGLLFRYIGGVHTIVVGASSMLVVVVVILLLPSIRRFD